MWILSDVRRHCDQSRDIRTACEQDLLFAGRFRQIERRDGRNDHKVDSVHLGEGRSLIRSDLRIAQEGYSRSDRFSYCTGLLDVTHLVGSVAILDDPISSNDDSVDILVLEQRSDHGITNHTARDLQCRQLERGQPGALVVRGGLGVVGSVEMTSLVQSSDDAQGSPVSLQGARRSSIKISH